MRKLFFVLLSVLILSLPAAEAGEETVSFNFENANLRSIISLVSKLTGTNFIFDEGVVSGTVTVKCPAPIPVSEVYSVLESILEVKNFAMVRSRNMVRILPVESARGRSTAVVFGRDPADAPPEESMLTQVIPLDYADSEETLKTVSALISGVGSAIASPKTNSLIVTDSASSISRILKVVAALDRESPVADKRVYVYTLENAAAETVAEVLSGIGFHDLTPQTQQITRPDGRTVTIRRPVAAAQTEQRVQVAADKQTNSLVITAFQRDYDALEPVLRDLDRRRDQVLIEALIAEVTMDKLIELGAELASWDEPVEGSVRMFGGTAYGTREAFRLNELSGALVGVMRGSQIGAILQYYRKDADFKILSSPYIFARDNEEAQIFIGEDVPFVRESRITEITAGEPTVIKTYDYRDVGINLRITPHINPSGYVRLSIYQLVEKLREGPSPDTPISMKREIENTVEVRDGHTVVIGGLIRDDTETVVRKVPLLGDIPLLGFFFRTSRDISQKTNLLIFITPHIITSPDGMRELTERKREEGRTLLEGESL